MAGSLYLRRRSHAARTRQARWLAARGARGRSRRDGARCDPQPQRSRSDPGRGRGARLRRSGRRSGRRHRARCGAEGRLRQGGSGRADQPLLRLGPRRGESCRRAGHVRHEGHRHRRRRRIHEPRRHGRLRRRMAGRSGHRHSQLLPAAGHLGRSDRDEIRLFARRRGRLCGRIAEARRESLGRGALCQVRRAGEGRQRPDHPRQGRAYAAVRPTCSRSANSRPPSCRWARWAASMRWRSPRIRMWSSSITSTMRATRRASSMALPAVLVGSEGGRHEGGPEAARHGSRASPPSAPISR